MGFKSCFIHAFLGVVSYILLGVAAIGGGIYLLLRKFKLPDGAKEYYILLEKTRLRLNRIYLIAGFSILTLAFILGMIQSSHLWKSSWTKDPKEIATAIVWLYYLGVAIMSTRIKQKDKEKTGFWFSVLSLIGLFLILLTFFLVQYFFTSAHRYL